MTKEEYILKNIAEDYHRKCDDFDNKICSGKNKYGESIPISKYERQLVNANAKIVLNGAYHIRDFNDISRDKIIKAIQKNNYHK